jgi:pimeloyl-ACP methyl ester carboxylesterase
VEPVLAPPRLEGIVILRDGRHLGYAEYGPPEGRPVLWFHGTPGARRQIPPVARAAADNRNVRLICVERPGVGASTRYLHRAVVNYADDIEDFTTRLGIDWFGVVALSGGGPYALACAYRLREKVAAAAVLGGVAPTVGPDAADGGVVHLTATFQPLLSAFREPLGWGLWGFVRALKPLASPVFDFYMRMSPEGDQRVFARPEMKSMFIDDLVSGGTRHFSAFVYDLVLFGRPWGFSVRDVAVPVRFWHGDADHIVPLAHGEHLARLVPGSTLTVRSGESHLGSLDAAEEILDTVLRFWRRDEIDARDQADAAMPTVTRGVPPGNGDAPVEPANAASNANTPPSAAASQ